MTMTTITETAYNLIPGNHRARTILKSVGVSRVVTGVPAVRWDAQEPAARAAVAAEVEELLAAGKPIPEDIADPIIAAQQADQAARVRAEVIDATAREAWSTGHDLSPEHINPALDYLRGQLERVITEATKQAKHLDGITTAEQVIEAPAKVKDAWTALTRLEADYREIRQVQRDLYRSADPEITNTQMHVAEFTDAIDIDPFWIKRRHANGSAQRGGHDNASGYAEWMISPTDRTPAPMDDTLPAALRMAHTHNVWLPDIDTLWEAYRAAHQATSIPTDYNVLDMRDTLRLYYQLTGSPPTINLTAEFANVEQKPAETKGGSNHQQRQETARRQVAERIGTPNNDPWFDKPSVPVGGWD